MSAASEIITEGDWHMSRVAARRLLQDGIRVVIEGDDNATYAKVGHPIFPLWSRGCFIAPGINIDMRPHLIGGGGNPEFMANYVLTRVLQAKAAFATSHPGVEFRWSLKNNSIGAPVAYSDGWTELPRFVSHPSDVPAGMFSSERMVPLNHGFGTWTVRVVSGATSNSFVIDATSTGDYRGRNWINQFPGSDYLTKTPAFYFQWTTGPNVGQIHRIAGWNPTTGQITLNGSPSNAIANGHEGKLYSILSWGGQADGCGFFYHGHLETKAWTERFIAEWLRIGAPAQVGRPVVYCVTAEDTHIPYWSAQAGRQYQANLAAPQATDPTQTMDKAGHTMAQHKALFCKDKDGNPIDMDSNGNMFSPQSGAQNGYLTELYFSAHGLWFQRAHFDPLKVIWPDTYMWKYKVPNPAENEFSNLLPRPNSEKFQQPDLAGVASMDVGTMFYDHYYLPIAAFRATKLRYGGTVTNSGHTPTTTAFKVVDTDTTNNPITSKANDYWNGQEIRIDGAALPRDLRTITDWDGGTDVFTVPALTGAPSNGQAISVLIESGTLIQEFNAGIGWDIYASFAVWASETLSAEGLVNIAKKWTKDLCQRTMERYPDVAHNCFLQSAGDVGADSIFPREVSWPETEFTVPFSYLSRDDWAELLIGLLRLGQNCFTWFQPSVAGQTNFADDTNEQATLIAYVTGKLLDEIEDNRETLELIAFGEATKASVRFKSRGRKNQSIVMVVGETGFEGDDEFGDIPNVVVVDVGTDAGSPSTGV